jgi:hypothetical protein
MPTGILTLNGTDAETLGFSPVSFEGMLGAPARTYNLLPIPGLPGGIDPGVAPMEAARTIKITGLVQAASKTALETTLDVIKEACGAGLVAITGPYAPTRAWYGLLQPFDANPEVPTVLNGIALIQLEFVCPSPYAVDLTPATIAFGATAVEIPLGTAPSTGRDNLSAIITITGAATTPIVTYKDRDGVTQGTLSFSGYSPLAGDTAVADLGRRLIYKFVSGVRTNAFSALAAGYIWPRLDPIDASVSGALWPTLATSAGSGSITYYRMWR